jgi:DNA-directed RNA polymerase subunit RPC12/RpoP
MKYILEDGIHFYEELKKSLVNEENKFPEVKRCLISNKPLDANCVTMECGHIFNYVPLYHDILNHKKKFNSMEKKILKTMEIRCPYCRNIQTALLPFFDLEGVEKVHGVNFVDTSRMVTATHNNIWIKGKCCYQTMIQNNSGVWETVACKSNYVMHVDMLGKDYCSYHKYTAIQEHLKEEKQKKKELIKAEKKKAKEEFKLMNSCKQIIKTGKNKGNACGCKIFAENVCKRHAPKADTKTK